MRIGTMGSPEIVGEQADAGTKWPHLAVCGVTAFREDQNAVAAVDGLSGIGEALAKAGFARQGKQIEQRHPGPTSRGHKLCPASFAPAAGCGATPVLPRRQPSPAVPEAERKRGLHEADIHVVDMVTHHQHRSAQPAQVFAFPNLRPSQQKYRRAQEQIMNDKPQPGYRPALHPRG